VELQECPDCAGIWLPVQTFDAICHDKEVLAMATRSLAEYYEPPKYEPDDGQKVRYLPCPKCKNLMNRRNFGEISGVIINTCRNCGVWLDNQALDHIVHFIQDGGMEKAHDHEIQEQAHRARMLARPPAPSDATLPLYTPQRNLNWWILASPVLARIAWMVVRALLK
jgi:Zn-finger nucleic acid-binding protein